MQQVITRSLPEHETKPQDSWQDFAGLSWIFLDDDLAELYLRK